MNEIVRRGGMLGLLLALVLAGCARSASNSAASTDPFPASAHLTGGSFVDQDHGAVVAEDCALGANGQPSDACRTLLFTTSDGGRTWLQESHILFSPRALQFVDPKNGWLVGSIGQKCGKDICPNAIMRTTDGGRSWERAAIASAALSDVHFVSALNGWAVGQSCISASGCSDALVATISGGQIWNNQPLPLTGANVQLARLGTENGWVTTVEKDQAVIARTSDGGQTWQRFTTPCRGNEILVNFPAIAEGWLVCNADASKPERPNVLYHSKDGGASWQPSGVMQLSSGNGSPTKITAIDFVSAEVGWSADDQGHLSISENGGRSWTDRLNANEPLTSVQFINSERGWALGTRHLWRTVDGGMTWSSISLSDASIDRRKPAAGGIPE